MKSKAAIIATTTYQSGRAKHIFQINTTLSY